jgi:fatty acid omega-hydroxylase
MFTLQKHPAVITKMRQEIAQVFGPKFSWNDVLTYEDIKSLQYTHAVFSEVLRLYPSVPKQAKTALQEDILPDGTVVPAGCM